MAWWRRRRFRRIADLGGHPVTRDWLYGEPRTVPFEPTPVDEARARRDVERAVAGLVPHAVDEATGHVPANLINSWADRWVDTVDKEYADYVHRIAHAVGHANAAVAQLRRTRDHDRRRLAELATGREAVFVALAGQDYPTPAEPAGPTAEPTAEPAPKPAPEPAGADDAVGPEPPASVARREAAGGAGYADPGLLAGRPAASYIHLGALLVAALADFGAFSQVVQLVMRRQSAAISYLVVGGLTGAALYLAHAVGVVARDRVAGVGSARRTVALACLAGWLALGAGACWVRLKVLPGDIDLSGTLSTAGSTAPAAATPTDALANAVVFVALFIGTGLVAATGAYLTHNPRRGGFVTLRRAHDRAVEQTAAAEAAYEMAVQRQQAQLAARDRARQLRETERHQRRAFAEDLKQHARVLLAQHHQDPAFTDALFDDDRTPYQPPPDRPA